MKRGLDPSRYTIKSVPPRVEKLGDLWAPVLAAGFDMMECLQRAERLVRPRPK